MAARKKQSLLSGATILVVATLIVKVIGALYKIPLSNLLGEVGYGYFSRAYNIYTYVYSISMAGLPVAVARMVSENTAVGRYRNSVRLLKVSRKLFLVIGLFFTALLAAIAIPYSTYVAHAPMNYVSMLAIAPCIFFCCLMSAYRGYYQGMQNMFPTAISQVIESVGKLILGLAFSYVVIQYGLSQFDPGAAQSTVFGIQVATQDEAMGAIYPYAAAGAIFGVTCGSLFGWVYLAVLKAVKGTGFTRSELVNAPKSNNGKVLAKKLIAIAVPIALGSLVFNASNIIDDATINARLGHVLSVNLDAVKQMYSYSLTKSGTADEDISTYLYGVYSVVVTLRNLIPAITLTLGTSAVPALAAAWSSKDRKNTRITIESVIRMSCLIAFPAGFGMAALSEPILTLLYASSRPTLIPIATPILTMSALGIVFFALATPLSNMLQSIGKTFVPLQSVAIGSVVKIALNYILIGNVNVNINGAAISSLVCYIIIVGYNLFFLLKTTGVRPSFKSVFLKPFISGLLCGIAAWDVYGLVTRFITESNTVATLLAIIAGAFVYALTLALLRGIARDDVVMFPKGEKIAKVLEKFKVLG